MRLPVVQWLFSAPAALFYCLATAGLHESLGSPPGLAAVAAILATYLLPSSIALWVGADASCHTILARSYSSLGGRWFPSTCSLPAVGAASFRSAGLFCSISQPPSLAIFHPCSLRRANEKDRNARSLEPTPVSVRGRP